MGEVRTVNEIIVSALRPFGLPIAENLYEGKEKEYFTYNFADDRGADFGDNKPNADVAYMQVHYICPLKKSYADMRRQIRQALTDAGATWAQVTDLSDLSERLRHLVFEFEIENNYEVEGM